MVHGPSSIFRQPHHNSCEPFLVTGQVVTGIGVSIYIFQIVRQAASLIYVNYSVAVIVEYLLTSIQLPGFNVSHHEFFL
jgi:hypothetical protein